MKYSVSSETIQAHEAGLMPFPSESRALESAIAILENLNLPDSSGIVVELYIGTYQGEPALMTRYKNEGY